MALRPSIGLEVHVQLRATSKLFSRSPLGGPPNASVSPFDAAHPGTMPVLNKHALKLALSASSLLGCRVPSPTRFARKHYFYADMPAGYQMTQTVGIGTNGIFPFAVLDDKNSYHKEIGITQIQLEQDSGKSIHTGSHSLIDLNRSGISLIEIVTPPTLHSAEEAESFIRQLRLFLMHHGITDGEMHKGELRVDANVSLSSDGQLGAKTEIKNMNSIRHVRECIMDEVARQRKIVEEGGVVERETRACDSKGRSVPMRIKEGTDYRFFYEPNIPPIKVACDTLPSPSSPPAYLYFSSLSFPSSLSVHWNEDPLLCSWVVECLRHPPIQPTAFIVWMKELKQICQRNGHNFPPTRLEFARPFTELIRMVEESSVTKLCALDMLRGILGGEVTDPREYLHSHDLVRITDQREMRRMLEPLLEGRQISCLSAKERSRLRNSLVSLSRKRISVEDANQLLK